jgi:hypothetical protein
LRHRLRDAVPTRPYSRRTGAAYVAWIGRYIVFDRKTHPAQMALPTSRSSSLPVVLSRDEVGAILKQLAGIVRRVVMLLYGAGLRLEVGAGTSVPKDPADQCAFCLTRTCHTT